MDDRHRALVISVAVFSVALAARAQEPPKSVVARTSTKEELAIADLVIKHCSDCHKRSVSDALPEALAVFDLDKPGWLAGIPTKHLETDGAFMARLLPWTDAKTEGQLRAAVGAELQRRKKPVRPGV